MLLCCFVAFAPTSARAADNDKTFKAGAYAADITPPNFPISVNGGLSDRMATKANDPLHARCLVLDDGDTRLVIVVCDSCMIPRDVFDEAKRIAAEATGIRADHMLMSATHTHSAPTSTGVFQSDQDDAYRAFLAKRIAEGVIEADKRRVPARIGWAVGLDPTQVFNRRWLMRPGKFSPDPFGGGDDRVKMNPGLGREDLARPAGPTDPEVPVVVVRSKDGDKPIALLANYSLHYVGGVPGDSLSADYFGVFANLIKDKINAGDEFVGIMSNGTSADINNVDFSSASRPARQVYEQMYIVAESVANAAFAAYRRVEYHDWVSLAAAEREIELGVRKPSEADIDAAVDTLRRAWAVAKSRRPELGEPQAKTPVELVHEIKRNGIVLGGLGQVYARETVLLSEYPDTVKAKLQAICIGDLGIVAIPCETFVEIGLSIKRDSPLLPTFTIELANGYNGYLPTPQQHEWRGYETWRARSSYLEEQASVKVEKTVMELLNEVARESAGGER